MVDQDKQSIDVAKIKKDLLESLNSVNPEDKINFLVNKVVNIDVETLKARNEVKGLREQANQVVVVSHFQ